MTEQTSKYHLSFKAGEVHLALNASGIDGATWAQITRAVHTELCKPTAIITPPQGLSGNEAESIRQQWLRERT